MAAKIILIVEDDEDIVELLSYNLAREGYRVVAAGSGEEALRKVEHEAPHLVLLDLMLPGIDGLEVCRRLRGRDATQSVPIIMLTAKGEESDIVSGLELGADDYMVKPFSPRVLLARIKTVLRRKVRDELHVSAPLVMGGLTIHPGRHEVTVDHQPVELTYTEFAVLYHLASRPGWVSTRYQIVEAVRGDNYPVTDRSVDVTIVGLRKKLGSYGACIETVRGVGYRFRGEE